MNIRIRTISKPTSKSKNTVTGPEISFSKGEKIGKGAIGVVYHAKLDIPYTHEMYPILYRHKWVFKEVPKKYYVESEARIAAKYTNYSNHQFLPIRKGSRKGWMTELIPGRPFSRENTKDLDFNQLMQLVFELVVRTNLFHHHTIRGNAVVHGDINRANIHFHVYADSSRLPEIDYFDYGMSFELTDDNPDLVRHKAV